MVVTWGVRSVVGALLAGMIFAIAPARLCIILILILFFIAGGLFVRLFLSKQYKKPLGAIAMAALAVLAFGGSAWLWDNLSTDDTVSVILVAICLAATMLIILRIIRLPIANRAIPIAIAVVVGIIGVIVATQAAGLELGDRATEVPTMLFGLGAIGLAREPRGVLYDMVNRQRLRQFREAERRDEESNTAHRASRAGGGDAMTATAPVGTPMSGGPVSDGTSVPLLAAEDITVRFGGVVALDQVSLTVPAGSTVGLVGPNGAGKTTLFGVLSGLLRPRSGRVLMNGDDITRRSPQSRARRGLARTFQRMELFTELTVREHLVVARRVHEGRQRFMGFFFDMTGLGERPGPGEEEAVDATLALLGLESVADRPAVSVPLGTGRLVEVARALASEPSVMLLDEPSSGLDVHETEQLGDALRRVRQERGTAFVLVEHNVEFVLDLSDRVTVLDFGRLLTEGLPDEVRDSPEVQAAYFGAPLDASVDAPVLEDES